MWANQQVLWKCIEVKYVNAWCVSAFPEKDCFQRNLFSKFIFKIYFQQQIGLVLLEVLLKGHHWLVHIPVCFWENWFQISKVMKKQERRSIRTYFHELSRYQFHSRHSSWKQVSISPTFYKQLFCAKDFRAAFLHLHCRFKLFRRKEIGTKAARKMLVKLTQGQNFFSKIASRIL